MLVKKIQRYLDLLIDRYPQLLNCKEDIEKAYLILEECYENDHKLLIAGNGGSAADSEHIAGELMKRFKIQRSIPSDFAKKLKEIDQTRGADLANNLERGLMAIPLVAHEALTTAYINDVDGLGVFAQQLYGFARLGDVFLGISTSGNSKNVMSATVVAKALPLPFFVFLVVHRILRIRHHQLQVVSHQVHLLLFLFHITHQYYLY